MIQSAPDLLRATLFCGSPSSQTAFYIGFPSVEAMPSALASDINSSYTYIKAMLQEPMIKPSSGSIEITRSHEDVFIGMNITAEVGVRDLELICYLNRDGVPPSLTMWLKDGEVINDSPQYNIRSDNRTLTFAEITNQDAGIYTCFVSNIYKMDSASSFLMVVDAPTEAMTPDPGPTASPTIPGPQWVPGGQWTECSQICGVGVRVRVLECIDAFGIPSDACEAGDLEISPFELCGTTDCPGEVRNGIPQDGTEFFLASSRLGAVNVSVTISGSSVATGSYTLTYDATNVDGSTINIVFTQISPGIVLTTQTISLQMPQFAKIEFEFLADNIIAVFIDGSLTYYINVRDGAMCYEVKESESFTYSNLLLTIDQQVQDLEPFEPINFVEGATFMGRTYFSKSAPTPFPGPLALCVDEVGQSAFYVNVPGAVNELNNILSGFRPPQLNASRVGEVIVDTSDVISIVIGQNLSLEIGAMVSIRASLVDMGTPSPPTVTWTKNGQVIQSGMNLYIHFGGFELTISDFQPSDSGLYGITVSNLAGQHTVISQVQAIIETGIIVRPAPPSTMIRKNVGVGQDTVTVSGRVVQVGIFCPVMVATANTVVVQTWTRNGTEVTSTISDLVDGNVTTYRMVDEFIGGFPDGVCIEYVCSVDIGTEQSFSESVEVCGRAELPPTSVSISGETTALRDGSTMLNCTAEGGSPNPVVIWTITPGSNMIQAQYTILSNGSLFLTDIPANEDTLYCCEAYNEFGTTGEACIALLVQFPPAIDNPSNLLVDFTRSGQDSVVADVGQRIEVIAGTNVTIRCNASLGNPMGMRMWTTVGGSPPSMDLADGSLFLAEVTMEVHEVDFICRVENDVGFDQESSWVRVYVPPEIAGGPPVTTSVFTRNTKFHIPQSLTVYVEPNLPFCVECDDNVGSPPSTILFQLDNKYIDFRDPQLFLNDSGSELCFRGITASYNGNYSCTATNSVGTDKGYVHIVVGEKPLLHDPVYPSLPVNGYVDRTMRKDVVVDVGFDLLVTAGATVTLQARVKHPGVPPTDTVFWFYDDLDIDTSDPAIEILDDGSLRILHAALRQNRTAGEEGDYHATVRNDFGSDPSSTTTLKVSGVAPFINTTFYVRLYPVGTYTTSVGAPQQIVNIQLYDTIVIACDAGGVFEPDIQWFVGGLPVNETLALHVVQPDGSLRVTGQTETPCIEYTCRATNPLGVAEKSVEICGERFAFEVVGSSACSATCGRSAHRTVVYTYTREVAGSLPMPVDSSLVPPSLLGPEQIVATNDCPTGPCPEEVYTYVTGNYSQCPECGGPFQQVRPVRCELIEAGETSGEVVDINFCRAFSDQMEPVSSQDCDLLPCPVWSIGDFTECSASCGKGEMVRNVSCIIPATNSTLEMTVDDSRCDMDAMPTSVQSCNLGQCPYTWRVTNYGPCTTTCQGGTQERTVQCFDRSTSAVIPTQSCTDQNLIEPISIRDCGTFHCSNYVWRIEPDNACSRSCGGGIQNQSVICHDHLTGLDVPDRFCNAKWKPPTVVECNVLPCIGQELCQDTLNICFILGLIGMCDLLDDADTDCCASCSGAR